MNTTQNNDIQRIREMERIFCKVCQAHRKGAMGAAFWENVRMMEAYMESGQWLHDYEREERGEWPSNMQRGVLSQDALYNLLTEIDEQRSKA